MPGVLSISPCASQSFHTIIRTISVQIFCLVLNRVTDLFIIEIFITCSPNYFSRDALTTLGFTYFSPSLRMRYALIDLHKT